MKKDILTFCLQVCWRIFRFIRYQTQRTKTRTDGTFTGWPWIGRKKSIGFLLRVKKKKIKGNPRPPRKIRGGTSPYRTPKHATKVHRKIPTRDSRGHHKGISTQIEGSGGPNCGLIWGQRGKRQSNVESGATCQKRRVRDQVRFIRHFACQNINSMEGQRCQKKRRI